MTSAEISASPRPQWLRFVDLLRSFPKQARLALGTRGVAWASVAGIIGLLCCAVSFAVVALSLHATEAEQGRHNAEGRQALDQSTRSLMHTIHLMTYGQAEPAEVDTRLRRAWTTYEASLAAACGRVRGVAADGESLAAVCAEATVMHDLMAPEIAAFDPQHHPINRAVLGQVIVLLGQFNAASIAAARDANGLIGTLIRDYGTALLVLSLSTTGFAGAGLVLILLVGRTSMDYHAQLQETRQARDMLRETIDALPAGIAVYDSDERLMMFNSTAAMLTPSLRRSDSIGKTYGQLAHETGRRLEAAGLGPQPVAEWIERFRSKASRRTRQAEDGRWFEWSEKLTPHGLTVGLRVDVTEIKHHEQVLERTRARYQSLIDSLSDVIYALDAKGFFTFASPAVADLLGVPAARLVGTRFRDWVVPEDVEQVMSAGRAFRHSPNLEMRQMQFRMQAADGAIRSVELRYRKPAGEGQEAAQVGVIRDISERVELTRRLEAETARLRSIVESSGALIVLVDRKLRVAMVNSGFTSMTGIAEADAVGRPLQAVMNCPFDPAILRGWQSGSIDRDRMEPARCAVKLRDPQGERRLIAVTATPVADSDGRMVNIVLLGVDDTQRREAEQALHDAERFATVGEMAGTMAHEISQPLQVINIACASAREELADALEQGGTPDNEYVQGKLDRIAQQVDCASRIIDGLRAFVRGTTSEQAKPFDPANAVQSAIDLTSYGMRQAGIALSASLADGLPAVAGDVGRLEQVLVNLINNACDAGGRTIGIIMDSVQLDSHPFVRIAVEDSGPGIAPGVLPHLFVDFVTTKPRGKGTGLGLRICRRIIEEMGGSISAANRAEGGARFEILLPTAT